MQAPTDAPDAPVDDLGQINIITDQVMNIINSMDHTVAAAYEAATQWAM